MKDVLIYVLGVLLYASGLLIWPTCALLWRGTGRRTRALMCVFFGQLLLLLALVAFFIFSNGLLEHQYYWLLLMIMLNLGFTPLAIGAACYDYFRGHNRAA
jgi:hypothetical protein